ncbi:hypothetical protein GCL60_13650 [Silvanigrella paludirubra]|uniref:Type I restriction modification DNA specificity domain-containing protein n=1 Tax=Silvanigrella paludirubra TaxID=2499159 RepID=A0A6N6VNW5_9BACT|nr:restriction endonuclease subunit S [Silvanigrella paludirubra]KAB8036883.1 hypothetical protein GCL60_13650 [Silvanigrella paludirubra]
MKAWEQVFLTEICRPKQWPTITQEQLTEIGYPVYGANGVIGYFDRYNHEEPTILITCRGATCGTINVCESKSYVTGNAMALDNLDTLKVNQDYLAHFLKHKGFKYIITGAAQPQITLQSLGKYKIDLPPLPEQKRIADILDRADELRTKRRQAIEHLNELKKSIFLDMFGDPVTNSKGWVIKPLEQLVHEFRYGTSNKSGEKGYPTLRIPNVFQGELNFEEIKNVLVDDSEFHRLKLQEGDLLIVRTNGNQNYVGRCAVFETCRVIESGYDDNIFIYASYLIRLRLRNEVNSIYLRDFLLSQEGRRQLLSKSKTSAGQYNINTQGLGSINIPIPCPNLQKKYINRIVVISKQIKIYQLFFEQLNNLFSSLQDRAFKGELSKNDSLESILKNHAKNQNKQPESQL